MGKVKKYSSLAKKPKKTFTKSLSQIFSFLLKQRKVVSILLPLLVIGVLVGSYRMSTYLSQKSVKGVALALMNPIPPQPINQLGLSLMTGCQPKTVGGAYVNATWNGQSGMLYDLQWGYVEDGTTHPLSTSSVTSPFSIPPSSKPGWMRVGHIGYVNVAVHGTGVYGSYTTFTVPNCTSTTPTPRPTSDITPTPTLNPIQTENQKQGTYTWYLTNAAIYNTSSFRTPDIEGYGLSTSVAPGNTIQFAVSTTAPTFSAEVFRFGYYRGIGARLIKTIQNISGHFYAIQPMNATTGLIEANWPVSFSLQTGSDWVSGMYLVKLTSSAGKQGYIRFIVTSGAQTGDFAFIDSTNTDAAYNSWGGVSLYENLTTTKLPFDEKVTAGGVQVSYNKPYQGHGQGVSYLWEYPMIYWLEQNGYNINYFSDVDLHKGITNLSNRKGIIIAGHSEYWSPQMRNNLQAAVDKGVNLAVFAANTMEWIVRLESSTAGVTARTVTSYKNSWQKDPFDTNPFADKSQVTSAWRYSPSSLNNAEQAILGGQYCLGCWFNSSQSGSSWIVADSSNWIFKGTTMHNGQSIPGIVGYEWDNIDSSFSAPSGVVKVAASSATTHTGTVTMSNTTIYTASSGARVFNAGTNWWSLGLMNTKNPVNNQNIYSQPLSQITKNILENFLSVPSVRQRRTTSKNVRKPIQTNFKDDDTVVGSLQAQSNSQQVESSQTSSPMTQVSTAVSNVTTHFFFGLFGKK